MKKLNILLILVVLSFGCNDNNIINPISEAEQLAIDLELIDNWLADSSITDVIVHPTGIRYTINKQGTGPKVEITDIVRISYEGRFLDTGIEFDSGEVGPVVFNAGWPFIEGWYHVVLEMSEGDEYTAYIPSKYAYGIRGSGTIPPNTVIVFDINMIRVTK